METKKYSTSNFKVSDEEFEKAQAVINEYFEERQRQVEHELEEDDFDSGPEPCSVCGEVAGMVNQCCASYDPLHFKNCGYG